MRNFILILAPVFLPCLLFSQTEKPAYKNAADKFTAYYNHDQYDSIFSLFSPDMQKALPADKTRNFLSGLKSQGGLIIQKEFLRYKSSYALYKTAFQQIIFTISISVDNESRINGLFVSQYIPDNLPDIKRNTTQLILPFKGTWNITWGGDTREQNYHVEDRAQKNAFDILIADKTGKTYKTDSKSNEDYYAFGQEILAPCDGEIVLAVDGIKDNKPGEMNPVYIPGNTVILKTAGNEYLFFAHFKQHSVKVREGQVVRQGQVLGLCGNSGNSSEAHLHFHIQNTEDMNIATGVKCYFDKIIVDGNIKKDYSPVRGEAVSNSKNE
jgi:murein DD-endopeptidase MepM/ murein hydrolase activator NlpD